jgi:hypothetical protein
MDFDEIDRALGGEEKIVPSSGFAASVMEAVRREATELPPIAFPWGRALPGIFAAGFAVVAYIVWSVRALIAAKNYREQFPAEIPGWLSVSLHGLMNPAVGWIVLTAAITYISLKFSVRMAR